MPPASTPCHPHPPAEAGCHCCSAGASTDAAPPVRSRSWHVRQRLAAQGLCHCGKLHAAPRAKYCPGCLERRRASSRKSERKRRLLLHNLGLWRRRQVEKRQSSSVLFRSPGTAPKRKVMKRWRNAWRCLIVAFPNPC